MDFSECDKYFCKTKYKYHKVFGLQRLKNTKYYTVQEKKNTIQIANANSSIHKHKLIFATLFVDPNKTWYHQI